MRVLGLIVLASIALVAFKAAIAVLMASYLVLLVALVIIRPKEAFALLAFLLVAGLLREHAVATLTVFVCLCAVGAIAKGLSR